MVRHPNALADLEYFCISQEICSIETLLSASNVTDWGSLSTYLDVCSVETSDVISVSGEMELIGSLHSYENKAVAFDQQKTKVEQVFDGHKYEPSGTCIVFFSRL